MPKKLVSTCIVILVALSHIDCLEFYEGIQGKELILKESLIDELPIDEVAIKKIPINELFIEEAPIEKVSLQRVPIDELSHLLDEIGSEYFFEGKAIGIKEYLKQNQQDEKFTKKPSFEEMLGSDNYTLGKKGTYQNLKKIQNFLESQGLLSYSRFGAGPGSQNNTQSPNSNRDADDGNNRILFGGEGKMTKNQYRHVWMDMLKEIYKILNDKSLLTKNKNTAYMMDYIFDFLNDIDALESHQYDYDCPSVYNNIGSLCLSLDFIDTFLDYDEARLYCQVVKGGDLAMFRNANEFEDIQRYIRLLDPKRTYSYWLGLSDDELENDWKFIDGRTVPFGAPFWGVSFDRCDFINNTCSINNATCVYWNTTCTASNATCGTYANQCNRWKPLCNTFYPTCTGWNNYTTTNCLLTNNSCVTWKANCTSWYSTCKMLYYDCYYYNDYFYSCNNSTGSCLNNTMTCAKWNVSCSTFYPACTGYNDYSVSCNRVNATCINWRTNCTSWHHTCKGFNETCREWNKTCTASNSTCGSWNRSCSNQMATTPASNAPCDTWDDLDDEPCIPFDRQMQPEYNNANENHALLLNMDSNYLHDATMYEAEMWRTIPLCQFIPERDMDNFQYGIGVWEDWNDYNEFQGWFNHEREKYILLSQPSSEYSSGNYN